MNLKILSLVYCLSLILPGDLFSQKLSYPGCNDITSTDFTKVDLVTSSSHDLIEPIKMKIDDEGKVYWVERRGLVRVWNPSDKQAQTLLDLSSQVYWENNGNVEYGVTGIALDPNFKTNHWVYIFWAVKSKYAYRISRFTLTNNTLNAEQAILEVPFSKEVIFHTAGGMAFDFDGDLYVAIGNNTQNGDASTNKDRDVATNYVNEGYVVGDDQRGTANTNSLLGKIIRIHPKPLTGAAVTDIGVGKTYDIPGGNLFPVGQFAADKTRPEIYTMGHRNPYTLNVDPYKKWITSGEVGPDEYGSNDSIKTEEHNLITKPGFMGWPYFVGNNQRYRKNKDPKKPTNTSPNNTGLTDLPPAQPALHPYGHSAATSGPIYRYDGRISSSTKLPPHFNKKWILSDNQGGNGGYLEFADVNETGDTLGTINRVFKASYLGQPLDLEIGPDGNLYALEYGNTWFGVDGATKLSRIEYHGPACNAPNLTPLTGIIGFSKSKTKAVRGAMIGIAGNMRVNLPEGFTGLQVIDLKGQQVIEKLGFNNLGNWVDLGGALKTGIYQVKFIP